MAQRLLWARGIRLAFLSPDLHPLLTHRHFFCTIGAAFVLFAAEAFSQSARFTHFEARQTHSLALTPDATRLLAVNSPAGRLAVFDVADPGLAPVLVAEIAVGLEPVAVRARTNDEVWVVNEVGDSVSIVSLQRGAVVATLATGDEPADVVFAQGKAFVACARSSMLEVFDATTRQKSTPIDLDGLDPRALATNAAGTKIYAAFLLSGNATTILPKSQAPAPPGAADPTLPAAPQTALIVPASDPRILYTVLDRDVVEVDAASGTVERYFGGAGTNLFDIAIHPVSGDLWVANTEALNLVRFEPELRGHFADNRLTRLDQQTGVATVYDLNPGIDYDLLPNPAAQASALAQPTSVVFTTSGDEAWVAAFASDRVAKLNPATGEVLARVDVRTGGGRAEVMRGPRALALHPAQPRLYVLNKLADTVSVVATDAQTVLAEVALATDDAMPATIRAGRGFLFDARLSGNGTVSCATCHLDADRDGLAWDLGDPTGALQTVMGANLAAHDLTPRARTMHPMKGPMVTQTLRGIKSGAILHWRGDRADIQSFNPTFEKLMGGPQLATAEIDALAEYLLALRHHPNPYRTNAGALPATAFGGNPTRGQALFDLHDNHCGICHLLPTGTDNNIDLPQEVGATQPLKNPSLATVYQRLLLDPRPGRTSLSGFGLGHDGTGFEFPTVHPYVLDQLATAADFADVTAFVMCFDTGTGAPVGQSLTVDAASAGGAASVLTRLETTAPTVADLVVEGLLGGTARRFTFARSRQLYVSSVFGEAPLTRSALLSLIGANDTLTFRLVQPLEGARFSGDRNRQAALAPDSYFLGKKVTQLLVPAAAGVMANDTRVSPAVDLATVVQPPGGGTAVLNQDGSLTYTPRATPDPAAIDSFTYRVLLASDAGNLTGAETVQISTMAAAAGRYVGHLLSEDGLTAAGFVDVTVSALGSWTGRARFGATLQALRGVVEVDGQLRATNKPKLLLPALRLSLLSTGVRQVAAEVQSNGSSFRGAMLRSPYSKVVPAPNAGTHALDLTVSTASGAAPSAPGRATFRLSKLGLASISGRLGDRTSFSASGMVLAAADGGWVFPSYSVVYKHPPGSVVGNLSIDPALPLAVGGEILAVKPPQTRPAPGQLGFTVEYAVSKVPKP